MNSKLKIYRKKIDIFHYTLEICVADDLQNAAKKYSCDEDLERYEAVVLTQNNISKVIVIIHHNASIGVISHEAVHAANEILDYVGIDMSYKNDEAQAYLVGYIAEFIHKKIGENNGH